MEFVGGRHLGGAGVHSTDWMKLFIYITIEKTNIFTDQVFICTSANEID